MCVGGGGCEVVEGTQAWNIYFFKNQTLWSQRPETQDFLKKDFDSRDIRVEHFRIHSMCSNGFHIDSASYEMVFMLAQLSLFWIRGCAEHKNWILVGGAYTEIGYCWLSMSKNWLLVGWAYAKSFWPTLSRCENFLSFSL